MNWQQLQVNLYGDHNGGTKWGEAGRVRTLREVLFSDFGDNISDIVALRKLDRNAADYDTEKKKIKKRLQCHTTAALLSTRQKETPEKDRIIKKTGLTQIDIDHVEAQGFDIDELKRFIFSFPFTCFVSVSCSGDGIFAIMAIAEPDKLAAYTEHVHNILIKNGIKVDTGKGKNYSDLRYVSYDANWLERDEVEPLRIRHFRHKIGQNRAIDTKPKQTNFNGNHGALIQSQIKNIAGAQIGQRWHTVQSAAYTLGGRVWRGLDAHEGLSALLEAIENNTAFTGDHDKYKECARVCFEAGKANPMPDKI